VLLQQAWSFSSASSLNAERAIAGCASDHWCSNNIKKVCACCVRDCSAIAAESWCRSVLQQGVPAGMRHPWCLRWAGQVRSWPAQNTQAAELVSSGTPQLLFILPLLHLVPHPCLAFLTFCRSSILWSLPRRRSIP
jgi:hypothetical protein